MLVCPLDCWDVCQLKLQDNKILPTSFSNFLCYKLNNYFDIKKEHNAYYKNQKISLSKAIDKLEKILANTNPNKILFIKGSGNLGNMPNITKHFFEKLGATFAIGSTCDGIGEEGIINSRGKSLILPTNIIKKAKNVIFWGRNGFETNIHIIPLIKNKNIISIDVIKNKTAKSANFYIEVKPNSDYFLAILLSRIVFDNNLVKNSDGNNFKEFKNIVYSYSLDELVDRCGVSLNVAKKLIGYISDSVILMGLGVSKCKECYVTTWAIDSLAMLLDLFGKEDRGVAYLGSSNFGIDNPFSIYHKNTVNLFDIDLDDFEVVFIQGSNPLVSFASNLTNLEKKTVIVFGKYLDQTAKKATIFIPTKDFFAKDDVRGSYFHEYVLVNRAVKDDSGISEYELTKELFARFGFDGLKEQDYYINKYLSSKNLQKIDNFLYKNKIYDTIPYKDGFYTKDKRFNFLNQKFNKKQKKFEIVTAKNYKALNSQFIQDEAIYISPKSDKKVLSWAKKYFKKIVFAPIQKNMIYAKGGISINKVLTCSGKNAYYDQLR